MPKLETKSRPRNKDNLLLPHIYIYIYITLKNHFNLVSIMKIVLIFQSILSIIVFYIFNYMLNICWLYSTMISFGEKFPRVLCIIVVVYVLSNVIDLLKLWVLWDIYWIKINFYIILLHFIFLYSCYDDHLGFLSNLLRLRIMCLDGDSIAFQSKQGLLFNLHFFPSRVFENLY